MAKPSHPVLVEVFSHDLLNQSNDATEVWQVTMNILLPKGTDCEKTVAGIVTGKWEHMDHPLNMACVDITKLK